MSISQELTNAIKLLAPYIDLSDRHAITAELLERNGQVFSSTGTGGTETIDSNVQALAMKLHEIVDGGVLISELEKELDNSLTGEGADATADKIRSFIRITKPSESLTLKRSSADRASACYINDIINYGGGNIVDYQFEGSEFSLDAGGIKDAAGLRVVELLNPRMGLSSRDTPGIGIFASLITTLEMSRCTPFVNVRINTTGSLPIGNEKQTYQGISLMSYLVGQKEISPGRGLDDYLSFENGNGHTLPTGLEVFTSPQLLVPAGDSKVFSETGRGGTLAQNGGVNNITPVADRFRPFMTLKGMSFNVAPSKGLMSYKTGKMEITLHDRSRLSEVASFVKPGLYSSTDITIEYGWSHPVSNLDRNPVGAFLNSQRVVEVYTVVNSSFNFEDSGQVNISLSLAMKGNSDLVSTVISDCGGSSAAESIEKILDEINKNVIADLRKKDSERFEKIFGDVIINAVGSTSAALSLDKEKLEELRNIIKSVKRNGNADEKKLCESLDKLFDETNGELEGFKNTARESVKLELDNLKNGIEIFPFHDLQLINTRWSIALFERLGNGVESEKIEFPISLGRILASFVGKPLLSKGNYEEVQLIFHTFNDKCTFMRDLSIAKYPISYDQALKEIEELMTTRTNVTISQFINALNANFMGNTGSKPYGFNFLYNKDENGNPTTRIDPKKEGTDSKDEQSKQYANQDKVIKRSGINDGVFKIPKICLYPECVPVKSDKSKKILRLHVIDEQCSSFSTLSDLLRSANSGDISSFGLTNDSTHPTLSLAPEFENIAQEKAKAFANLQDNILVGSKKTTKEDPNNKKQPEPAIELEVDTGKLLQGKSISQTKKFISQGIPVITYGKDGGTIKSIGLQSLSDPALSTINMLRMSKADVATPDLTLQRGLPMQVAPTECSIEMMGCPLLSYGQQFFIDFGTGTTADNLYLVTGIDHKIDPGSFTTSVKLTFSEAYGKYTSQTQKIITTSEEIRNLINRD
jgi:hypothetical protein